MRNSFESVSTLCKKSSHSKDKRSMEKSKMSSKEGGDIYQDKFNLFDTESSICTIQNGANRAKS